MKFEPGNTLAKGGKREGAGRKKQTDVDIKRAAAVLAKDFIDKHARPVLDNYLKLAQGYYEPRYTALGQEYQVFVPDGPTTRHFIDKLIPDDKSLENGQTINILIAPAASKQEFGPEPELRADSLQIHLGGNNGQNGNGSDSA